MLENQTNSDRPVYVKAVLDTEEEEVSLKTSRKHVVFEGPYGKETTRETPK